MKYHGSARPANEGKVYTVRLRTFSATLVYPEPAPSSEGQKGKRSRYQGTTPGKFNRKGRLDHRTWCSTVRKWSSDRRSKVVALGRLRRTHLSSDLAVRFTPSVSDEAVLARAWLSGGSGTKLDKSRLRAYAVRQVFLQTWPARVANSLTMFFDRLAQGLCLWCGNHVEFGFMGCFQHACLELQRLREAADVVLSVLGSLDYTTKDDFEAVLWGRASLSNLAGQYIRIQVRIAVMFGAFGSVLLPSVLRRGYNLVSVSVDLARLALVAGGNLDLARAKYAIPSQRSLLKSTATLALSRDVKQVVRELIGKRGELASLDLLITDPSQFVLNSSRVQGLFTRLGKAELLVRPSLDSRRISLTHVERDLLFVLTSLHQGVQIPEYVRKVWVSRIAVRTTAYPGVDGHSSETVAWERAEINARFTFNTNEIRVVPEFSVGDVSGAQALAIFIHASSHRTPWKPKEYDEWKIVEVPTKVVSKKYDGRPLKFLEQGTKLAYRRWEFNHTPDDVLLRSAWPGLAKYDAKKKHSAMIAASKTDAFAGLSW